MTHLFHLLRVRPAAIMSPKNTQQLALPKKLQARAWSMCNELGLAEPSKKDTKTPLRAIFLIERETEPSNTN